MTATTDTADVGRVAHVRLGDVDPDLAPPSDGRGPVVPVFEIRVASSAAAVTSVVRRLGRGVILKGYLLRDLEALGGSITDLLGPGDILFGHDPLADGLAETRTQWHALERALIVDLSGVTPSGAVCDAITRRLESQLERAQLRCAIESIIRVDLRVLAYLWHLASTWGVVTPDGVRLEIPLTHALLASLVGARRPTVTTALGALSSGGYIRRDGRCLTLIGECNEALARAARG